LLLVSVIQDGGFFIFDKLDAKEDERKRFRQIESGNKLQKGLSNVRQLRPMRQVAKDGH